MTSPRTPSAGWGLLSSPCRRVVCARGWSYRLACARSCRDADALNIKARADMSEHSDWIWNTK